MSTTAIATLEAGPANPTHRGYLAETWLPSYIEELKASDRLWRLAFKRNAGPDRDAMTLGACAIGRQLNETVKFATSIGGLPLMWEGSKALQGGAA